MAADEIGIDEKTLEKTEVIGEKDNANNSVTQVDLETHTGFYQTIDRSDFEYQYTTFGELLNRLPGIQIRNTSGFGSANTVSVRGSNGKQVNLYLDGVLLNSPSSGVAKLHYMPTVLVDRVEVYPDITPVQLGNANLAGAINFTSRRVKGDEPGGQIRASYGSFETQQYEASGWGSVDGYEGILGISYLKSKNDFPVEDDIFRTPYTKRLNDQIEQTNTFLKGSKDWDVAKAQILWQYYNAKKGVPTVLNRLSDDATLEDQTSRVQTVIDYNISHWAIGHRLFYASEDTTYSDPNNTVGLDADVIKTDIKNFGIHTFSEAQLNEQTLGLGLEISFDSVDQQDEIKNEKLVSGDRRTLIFAISDDWQVSESWLLNATARYYWVEDSATLFASSLYDADDDPNSTTTEPAFQVGAQWAITPVLTFKSNIGRLIRIPTLYEKYGSTGLFLGNPNLVTEKAYTLDAGINWKSNELSFDLIGFVKQVDDGIYNTYDSRGVGHPENIANAFIAGVEAKILWQPIDWWEANANTTLLHSDNQSDIPAVDGNQLPGIYHQSFGVGTAFFNQWVRWSTYLQAEDDLYYNRVNSVKADDKTDIGSSLTFYVDRFTFDVTARNLLNKNFLDYNRMPTPGRSFIATFTVDL